MAEPTTRMELDDEDNVDVVEENGGSEANVEGSEADVEEEGSEEEGSEEEGWETSHGMETYKVMEFIMCGHGANRWNYVVEFNNQLEQTAVYISNEQGRTYCPNVRLAYRHTNQLRLVDADWEPPNEDEGLVYYWE